MITFEQFQRANQAYLVAAGFFNVSVDIQELTKDGLKLFMYNAYPLTVNAALACEIYLKTLLILQNGTCKHTHHLDSLYSNLSEDNKAQVKALYDEAKLALSLENCLKTYRNACVEWRYLFNETYKDTTLTMAWSELHILNAALNKVAKSQLDSHPYNTES